MLKRAVYIAVLWFANILLLAHVAIPHHHENATICLFDTHCNNSHEDTKTHERESNSTFEKCCIIDNVYTRTDNNIKAVCLKHTKCNCGQALYALIPNTTNIQDFVDKTLIHLRQSPYVPPFYSEFISQSKGLRAPPACWFSSVFSSAFSA